MCFANLDPQYQRNLADQREGRYQADISTKNAGFADAAAVDARNRGGISSGQQISDGAKISGTQRASMAANNIRLDSGSPLDILAGTAGQANYNASVAQANGDREAFQEEVSAWNQREAARGWRRRTALAKQANRNIGKSQIVASGNQGGY